MCGGLKIILETLKVKNIVISMQKEEYQNFKEIMDIVKQKKVNVIPVKRGDRLTFDSSSYANVLYPTYDLEHGDINNNSVVTKIICNNTSLLFTGDIEKEAEERILCLCNIEELKADILKVAHHGSKTSSTYKFLEAVKPKIALIGVGANNKFGHPNDEVIDRLTSLRCKNI